MATVQEPRSRPKYDEFLDARLERTRQQVRAADLGVATLGLVALTFAFGMVMLLVDKWLDLHVIVRQIALGGFVIGAAPFFRIGTDGNDAGTDDFDTGIGGFCRLASTRALLRNPFKILRISIGANRGTDLWHRSTDAWHRAVGWR